MLYKIAWGDRSGDGHSMTDQGYVRILSDHGIEDLRVAYENNCERWGKRLSDIGEDYEDSRIPEDVVEKMKADGVDVESFAGEFMGDYHVEDPLQFAMAFMSHGIEGFKYERAKEEAVSLVGDYGSKVETESYGYGFLIS